MLEKVKAKHWVKYAVLKRGYRWVSAISPQFAAHIRTFLYQKFKPEAKAQVIGTLPRSRPLVLIDVTETTRVDVGTGIQRVTNHVFQELAVLRKDVIAVREYQGKLITSRQYEARLHHEKFDGEEYQVSFLPGDTIFFLDSSWCFADRFHDIFEDARTCGVRIACFVYDFFPLAYPAWFDAGFIGFFWKWYHFMLQYADDVICDSRTTANVVSCYVPSVLHARNKEINMHFAPLGGDIPNPSAVHQVRDKLRNFVARKPTFLMVGTVEIRKGHAMVLRAFQSLCATNEVQLLIIGHNGWQNEEFHRLYALPEVQQYTLWLQDASDEELCWAYQHVRALIAASRDEGFGLPLIEAAYYHLPILCSDIPIFREVTEGYADYFHVMEPLSLAKALKRWLEADTHPDSSKIRIHTWRETAEHIDAVLSCKVVAYKRFSVSLDKE